MIVTKDHEGVAITAGPMTRVRLKRDLAPFKEGDEAVVVKNVRRGEAFGHSWEHMLHIEFDGVRRIVFIDEVEVV